MGSPVRRSRAPRSSAPDALPNLGPASAAMLARAGIGSIDRLRALGAVRAFDRVRRAEPSASLNLLWAIEGALSGRPWQAVARDDRTRLLFDLDDMARDGDVALQPPPRR